MNKRASSKQRAANSRGWRTGLLLLAMAWGCFSEAGGFAWAGALVMEAEVLEGSGSLDVPGGQAGHVRYALIHHAREQDQATFSQWLRSHQSARVTLSTKDGQPHQGMLSRLKHCFGRGLLIYSDPVALGEKDIVRLELPREEK